MAGRDPWTSPVNALLDGVESTAVADTGAPETEYGSPWARALREIMERHTGARADDFRYLAPLSTFAATVRSAADHQPHPDQLGSIIATLDSGAEASTKTGYAPVGKNTSAGPFAYTGQRIDPETGGLHDHRAPMYQPAWARFMQPEPVGYQDGGNFSASSQPQLQLAAGLTCQGFPAGCQSGGSYGTTGMYNINGRRVCMDCAIKLLGIQGLPAGEKTDTLERFLIKGENNGVDPARPQGPAG
jgi:RHS repeat-associated protein